MPAWEPGLIARQADFGMLSYPSPDSDPLPLPCSCLGIWSPADCAQSSKTPTLPWHTPAASCHVLPEQLWPTRNSLVSLLCWTLYRETRADRGLDIAPNYRRSIGCGGMVLTGAESPTAKEQRKTERQALPPPTLHPRHLVA